MMNTLPTTTAIDPNLRFNRVQAPLRPPVDTLTSQQVEALIEVAQSPLAVLPVDTQQVLTAHTVAHVIDITA